MSDIPKQMLRPIDKLLDAGGYIIIIVFWTYTLIHYTKLPDTIPIHFGLDGAPDKYGHKSNILLLPGLSTIMFIAFTLIIRFIRIRMNTVALAPNELMYETIQGQRLMRGLRTIIMLTFFYLTVATISIAHQHADKLNLLALIFFGVLMFVPIIMALYSARKSKR